MPGEMCLTACVCVSSGFFVLSVCVCVRALCFHASARDVIVRSGFLRVGLLGGRRNARGYEAGPQGRDVTDGKKMSHIFYLIKAPESSFSVPKTRKFHL